jgi:Ca-activated chloride channel family protein
MRPFITSLLTLLATSIASLNAQTIIEGRVVDPSGATIPAVTLTLSCDGKIQSTTSAPNGQYRFANLTATNCTLTTQQRGFRADTRRITLVPNAKTPSLKLDITLQVGAVSESVAVMAPVKAAAKATVMATGVGGFAGGIGGGVASGAHRVGGNFNTESYRTINENSFRAVSRHPLSTFSADSDTASFTNTRRFLREGQLPPQDSVRAEEFLNYFRYQLPAPLDTHPIRIHTELGPCPWQPTHQLLFVGLKTRELPPAQIPPANFVFLIDVSGSMNAPHKLPLLKQSFRLLVEQLRPQDQVSIVVYAGASGLALPTTRGNQQERILDVIQQLQPGGSTNGAAGIHLAYQTAEAAFIQGGNNRVILATDGDFNVGVSGDSQLVRLIEEKRKSGIFLTILGYGMGNYKDGKLEQIANAGNGNFAYIDNILEARKFLVRELGQNLLTVAKDVKLQLEFNPAHVAEYRLIGYENRLLNAEDFKDDTKDAGELGSGHTMVALYELIPPKAQPESEPINKLRYQREPKPDKNHKPELLQISARYKAPSSDQSTEFSHVVLATTPATNTPDFYFAASVAELAMLLSESKWKGTATFDTALDLATRSLEQQSDATRATFPAMIERAKELKQVKTTADSRHPASQP